MCAHMYKYLRQKKCVTYIWSCGWIHGNINSIVTHARAHMRVHMSDMRACDSLVCARAYARCVLMRVNRTGAHPPTGLQESVFYHIGKC